MHRMTHDTGHAKSADWNYYAMNAIVANVAGRRRYTAENPLAQAGAASPGTLIV